MDNQDHKITTPSGHENHGPYLCHKCGWPFPNQHPSARHRRAHKKVCGKIEGYKLSESETADNSTHSAVSDDEHHSDGDHRTPSPNGKMTSVKSYRSEDESYSDAVTEFADSGISPGMEEGPESVKKIDDELLKVDATGGISGSSNDAAEVNDPESLESGIDQPVADKSVVTKLDSPIDASPIKSEIPLDASLKEINATESIEAKQVQISSGRPNDLKGIEDISAGEGLVDAVEASVEVSQSVVSDTDEKTSNNESYESKPLEVEGQFFGPSTVESKSPEAEEQATDNVPIESELQHKERENPDSADLKLDLSEAQVKSLDVVNVEKEHEQLGCCIGGGGISTQLSPILVESKADSSNEIDGVSQTELSDSSKAEEGREDDVHVLSLAKDLPASDNPELLKDFKDFNKFKSSLPLDLGSSEEICSAKDDAVAASMVSTLDVSGEQISEEKLVVSAEGKSADSKADSSNEIDGGSQTELADSSKAEEGRQDDVHVLSLAKDLPASDNPELLKDFKDFNKFKSSLPLDLGSSEEIRSAKDDAVAASMVSTLNVSGEQVSEANLVVSAEGKSDSIGLASDPNTFECGLSSILNSNGIKESEDSSKNSPPSVTPADLSDMNTVTSSEAKQTTKVDDPVIERTEETSCTMAEEKGGRQTENELFGNKETTLENTICLSEANQTMVTVKGIDHDEHEKVRTEHPIVAGSETEKERTEEKLAGVSETDKTICPVGGHHDRAITTDTTVHESRDENFHEASEESTISNDAKALESASATGLDSKIISDSDAKEQAGLLVDSDLNSHVVENSHAGDVLKSATGIISSASQNESNDKLIKSAVDTPMTSSSRADSLDANWGSVSVLSTQSESTAVPDAEATDTRGLEKSEHDLQKPTSGADKSDLYEPPSFMTLVESGESADKKKAGVSEIETQKAGWFPSITNALNESQGRKKNEEIIAKVTNWSGTTKQHTPLKNLLGEARSPNAKQVPKKDETASTKTTTVNSILSSEVPTKEAEKEWNSPARYPVDIKKEKRKTKPYWVPFVCCSSVHQDA